MSKKDEKDINISKLDKSLEGQGLLEDADTPRNVARGFKDFGRAS